jgi:3-phenylpropionate/trans-cinnamate dioxygenase ferredoxin component
VTLLKRWYEVASTRDIDDEEALQVEVNGDLIALFNLGGKFYAVADRCPVTQASLAGGYIEDGLVYSDDEKICYEIRTGLPRHDAGDTPVRRYPVKIDNGLVYIGVVIASA